MYALDTLYNLVPRWSDVRRMTDLATQRRTRSVLSSGRAEELSDDVHFEPPEQPPYDIIRYTPVSPNFTSREDSAVSMIVLHGDPGPASETLERMTTFGSKESTHYYLTADGTIYQLVDDPLVAWHSGTTELDGRSIDIDLISIGIVLERSGDQDAQLAPLQWLLQNLLTRYKLPPHTILRWSELRQQRQARALPTAPARPAFWPLLRMFLGLLGIPCPDSPPMTMPQIEHVAAFSRDDLGDLPMAQLRVPG